MGSIQGIKFFECLSGGLMPQKMIKLFETLGVKCLISHLQKQKSLSLRIIC